MNKSIWQYDRRFPFQIAVPIFPFDIFLFESEICDASF